MYFRKLSKIWGNLMSKSTVLALAAVLGNTQGDTNELDKSYDRITTVLAKSPWNVEAALVPTAKGTVKYTLDEDVGNILFVFYDDQTLALESIAGAKMFNHNWRDVVGEPFLYIREQEDSKDIRLFPQPDKSASDFVFLLGESFGVDYPENAIVTIHTIRKQDWADQFDLPLTLEILADEFARETEHQDISFATACKSFAALIFGVL